MYGGQEKILGQKVNVKFFTVDPYVGGTGVPRTFLEMGKIQKNIFLKIKTSIIKSEKIYIKQYITPASFLIFLEFFLFFCIFPHFLKKKYQNSEKITPSFNRFHSQILLNDFGFWDFSTPPRHADRCEKIPNPSKSSPVGLWKRLYDFFPLVTGVSMTICIAFWAFFSSLF